MKILLVNKFHYVKGGSETYYFSLGDLLKKRGHEVIWFSMKDERNVPCDQEKYFVENVDFNASGNPMQLAKASAHLLYSTEAARKFAKLLDEEKSEYFPEPAYRIDRGSRSQKAYSDRIYCT